MTVSSLKVIKTSTSWETMPKDVKHDLLGTSTKKKRNFIKDDEPEVAVTKKGK